MKEERILQAIGQANERYIAEAEPAGKVIKRYGWMKWTAAAACLGLIAGGLIWSASMPHTWDEDYLKTIVGGGSGQMAGGGMPDAGGGVGMAGGGAQAPGGLFPDGVDPATYSVAVYPEGVDVQDVTASVRTIGEEEARGIEKLGAYLPTSLPEGYHFRFASLYETTVKDGTRYNMLRVTYSNGTLDTPHTVVDADGSVGEIAPTPEEMGENFVVSVCDFKPRGDCRIYASDAVTESLPWEPEGPTIFYLEYGDVYVGILPEGAEDEVILEAVRSIQAR